MTRSSALALFAIALTTTACRSEKDDFVRMKPEVDPIVSSLTPIAAELERAKKESAPPSSTEPLRLACAAAQKAAADTHFDILMFRASKARASANAFQEALTDVATIATPEVSADIMLIGRFDSAACEKAFAKLCVASSEMSAAAKAEGVAIEPICR
ncbi:hypothetical protein BH09MYX1_BH09MYX1_16090 [soil metagenome]